MNPFYTSCLLFTLLPSIATAQASLSGSIQDQDGKPLPFASIALLDPHDSTATKPRLVKGTLSTQNGEYRLENVPPGNYLLTASLLGYKHSTPLPITVENKTLNLPDLTVVELPKNLQEVTVTTKKPLYEQQLDRMVINVQNSIASSGGNALETLERSPGVTVNRQNNTLKMNGKSSVMLMLNNKLVRLPMETVVQILENTAASDIEKIELITTPPARYDAEGTGGIIHIIQKKNSNFGSNGNLSATLGYGWYERPSATLSLNHRNAKLNLYGSYSFDRHRLWSKQLFTRAVQQKEDFLLTDIVVNGYSTKHVHTLRLGFDYSITPYTTLQGLVSGFDNQFTQQAPNTSINYLNNKLIKNNNITNSFVSHWQHLLLNMTLRHIFKNKQEWSLDIDRLYYNSRNPTQASNDIWTDTKKERQEFKIAKETPIRMWVIKSDFQMPIGSQGKLETGLKATSARLNNGVRLEQLINSRWQADSFYTQHYKLAEDILATYVNLNQPLSANTTLQAGLRYEFTQSNLTTPEGNSLINRKYGNVFSSLFLSHKFGKDHAISLSYSRRITRPSYTDMAPFIYFIDPNTYFSGNPALLPTLSNAIQGSYTLKEAYAFSVKYSADHNSIAPLQPHPNPATNQLYYYPENIARLKTVSLTTNLPWSIASWWESQNSLTGLWQNLITTYQDNPINTTIWNVQLSSSHTFRFPRKFTAELTGTYMGPYLEGIYWYSASGQVTAGVQKMLPNGKGTLQLSISDLFWTTSIRWSGTIPTLHVKDWGSYRTEPRIVRLTYKYAFGNKNIKAGNRRTTGSDEERGRVQSN